MNTPKKITIINGVEYWDCLMCKKTLSSSCYTTSKLHASYCKKCAAERSRKSHVPKPRGPYKYRGSDESADEMLKSLQAFDSSWTMEKLNKAKNDPI